MSLPNKPKKEPEFWVINRSIKKDVSIGDLRVTIRKGERKNLLSKHYNFTIEQLKDSASTGSIYKKSNFLSVQEVKPRMAELPQMKDVVKGRRILVPLRNPANNLPPERFEELDFEEEFMGMTEEQFAAEQADAERAAHTPVLAVDNVFIAKEDDIE